MENIPTSPNISDGFMELKRATHVNGVSGVCEFNLPYNINIYHLDLNLQLQREVLQYFVS